LGERVGTTAGYFFNSHGALSHGALLMRKHMDKKNRTDNPDSMERGIAQRARADAFGFGIVMLGLFALYMFLTHQLANGLIAYGLMGLSAVAFWIRYSFLRNRVS
jgi:hypothetical protein